jgi:hypothetical protein
VVWLQLLFRPADFHKNFAGGPGPFDKPECNELYVRFGSMLSKKCA